MKAVAGALWGDVGPPAKNLRFGKKRLLEGGPHAVCRDRLGHPQGGVVLV